MQLKKIVAIIRNRFLIDVEARLVEMRVKGISVTKVKGYGEYANFFNHNWLVTHSQIEIFTEEGRVDEIVAAIMETANTGQEGDGILAILPVSKLYRIRTKSEITQDEF
ncbi:MAG: P-II family nitrogen regulator [Deltaproteobacteria bacterium]|nr:P-II family nitrogen regulator [Deltaproteobacteria bacterium]TLN04149.1 MAG: P-II family nitrogen regulator [bacterium]